MVYFCEKASIFDLFLISTNIILLRTMIAHFGKVWNLQIVCSLYDEVLCLSMDRGGVFSGIYTGIWLITNNFHLTMSVLDLSIYLSPHIFCLSKQNFSFLHLFIINSLFKPCLIFDYSNKIHNPLFSLIQKGYTL